MAERSFYDGLTNTYCSFPFNRDEARELGFGRYMDINGCEVCGTKYPKARYVEDNQCYGCLIQKLNECLSLFMQGMPGRPEPWVTTESQAAVNNVEWVYCHPRFNPLCEDGPHLRKTHLKTKKCVTCEENNVNPRAIARASRKTRYTPTKPCKECGQIAERNVTTNKCYGCTGDGRKSESGIMAAQYPDMVISRDDAKALGLTLYRTGEPCRRGHRSWRYVSTNNCTECRK